MKRITSLVLSVILLLSLIPSALALSPKSTKSLICIDRKYNFLDPVNYTAISSSVDHTALIDDVGGLWMFGSNKDGKLGIGDIRNSYNAPIKVLENVAKVKTSEVATTAVMPDGSVRVFGKNVSSTPKEVTTNCIDAHFDAGLAYIDKSGKAYFKSLQDQNFPLCDNAADIYVVFNGANGNGFSGSLSSNSAMFGSKASYFDIKTSFIIVLKNDGTVVEYSRNATGLIDSGTVVAENVVKMTMTFCYGGAYGAFMRADGSVIFGDTVSGVSPTSLSDCKTAHYTPTGFYVLKTNGELWNVTKNVCLGKSVKLFAIVGGGGVFMVHNDGTVSANDFLQSGNFSARLNAVNYGRPFIPSHTMYEDIYAKTMELCGNETDKYINAKNISSWIQKNIKYQSSVHDQSGVAAFREGTGVCAAFASLTQIMLSYIDIPTDFVTHPDHAWNTSIIDGVTVFTDNTNISFDDPIFSSGISHSNLYNAKCYDSWAATEIRGAFDYGLITRQMSYDFRDAIKRADFCALICNVIEKTHSKSIDSVVAALGKSNISVPFTDTTDAAVAALFRLGIINGTSATTFSPHKNITREEAAKIMRNLALVLGEDVTATKATFADLGKVSSWAVEGVSFVSSHGIMNGRPNGFDPKNTISIQESILITFRYFGNVMK